MTGALTFSRVTAEEAAEGRAVAAVVFGQNFMTGPVVDAWGREMPGMFTGYFHSEKAGTHLKASQPMTLKEFVGLREQEVLEHLSPESQGILAATADMVPLPSEHHMDPVDDLPSEPVSL
jgi:hypothetical protein